MEKKGEKGEIIIHLNGQGDFIYVEVNGKRLEPSGNLARNPPEGVLNGIKDIGHIVYLKRSDGTQGILIHLPNCWYINL